MQVRVEQSARMCEFVVECRKRREGYALAQRMRTSRHLCRSWTLEGHALLPIPCLAVFVPVGRSGGLLAGIAAVLKAADPAIQVVGVYPTVRAP